MRLCWIGFEDVRKQMSDRETETETDVWQKENQLRETSTLALSFRVYNFLAKEEKRWKEKPPREQTRLQRYGYVLVKIYNFMTVLGEGVLIVREYRLLLHYVLTPWICFAQDLPFHHRVEERSTDRRWVSIMTTPCLNFLDMSWSGFIISSPCWGKE